MIRQKQITLKKYLKKHNQIKRTLLIIIKIRIRIQKYQMRKNWKIIKLKN